MLGSDSTPGVDPMDAMLTGRDDLSYSDKPPVIVAASSDAAMRRAARTIESSGLRLADQVAVSSAKERIERQAATSAVWLELVEDSGGPLDEILALIDGISVDDVSRVASVYFDPERMTVVSLGPKGAE